jgi:hypothetical protein
LHPLTIEVHHAADGGLDSFRAAARDESAKFFGGLIKDAFQLFGAPGMPEAAGN